MKNITPSTLRKISWFFHALSLAGAVLMVLVAKELGELYLLSKNGAPRKAKILYVESAGEGRSRAEYVHLLYFAPDPATPREEVDAEFFDEKLYTAKIRSLGGAKPLPQQEVDIRFHPKNPRIIMFDVKLSKYLAMPRVRWALIAGLLLLILPQLVRLALSRRPSA